MPGTEIATAYISLVPSATGITSGIQKEMGAPITNAAKASGDKASKSFTGSFSKGTSHIKEMLLGAIGAATVIEAGKSIVEATDNLEHSHAQLAVALKNTGSSADKYNSAIKSADKSGEHFGFTSADTQAALARLVTATGSGAKATKLLSTAQDLAAQTGKPLVDAATAVAKANEGNLRPLKQLGIDLPIAAGGALKLQQANTALKTAQDNLTLAHQNYTAAMAKGDAIIAKVNTQNLHGEALVKARSKAEDEAATLQEAAGDKVTAAQKGVADAQAKVNLVAKTGTLIMDALGKKIGGAAASQAETFSGKVKALKSQLTDAEATIGTKLIPVIESLIGAFIGIVQWFSKGSAAARIIEVAIGALLTIFLAYKIGTLAVAAAQVIATVATTAWTVATTLLGVAMVILTSPITLIVVAIAALVVGVILAYQHFGLFHSAVDLVWQILQNTFHWLQSNWPLVLAILTGPFGLAIKFIIDHWEGILSFFKRIPEAIRAAFTKVESVLEAPFKAAFGFIQRLWDDSVGKIFSLLFGGGGKAPSLVSPNKAHPVAGLGNGFGGPRAAGGPVVAGRSYLVGERGPELFTPDMSGGITPNGARGIDASIHFHGPVTDFGILDEWADKRDQKLVSLLRAG